MYPAKKQIRLRDTEAKLAKWLVVARAGQWRDASGNHVVVFSIQDKYDEDDRLIEIIADVA